MDKRFRPVVKMVRGTWGRGVAVNGEEDSHEDELDMLEVQNDGTAVSSKQAVVDEFIGWNTESVWNMIKPHCTRTKSHNIQ